MAEITYFNGVFITFALIITGILILAYLPRIFGMIVEKIMTPSSSNYSGEDLQANLLRTEEREKSKGQDGRLKFYEKGF